jgi:hypothetical protein
MAFDAKSASRRERKEPSSTAYLLDTPRGWRTLIQLDSIFKG